MPYGFLSENSSIERTPEWFGIPLREDLPTRWEEFTFGAKVLQSREPGSLLDAACGFEPGVHIFPQIAASLGWRVKALDLQPPWEGYPEDPLIERLTGDITALPFADSTFDAAVCISALEHMEPEVQKRGLEEMVRVCKPGATFALTIDRVSPLPYVEFLRGLVYFDYEEPFRGVHLEPAVSFLWGTRR